MRGSSEQSGVPVGPDTMANGGPCAAAPSPRVLVVDDDSLVLSAISRILRARGYSVIARSNGGAALERLGTEEYDVIVSDIAMPGMDGIALMRAVREVDLDIPIILLTGSPSLETAQRAVDLGAFRYLTKPASADELCAVVSRAVAAHRLARLKRDALALMGANAAAAGDVAGLQAIFRRTLASLWIAYQPIVRAADGGVYGYEALLRSEESALPTPAAVLDAAERLGRLADLGRVVRSRAGIALQRAAGHEMLFMNLHPDDLLDDELLMPDTPLCRIARRVVLEITERTTIKNLTEVRRRLLLLRKTGYRIALDDLGAGYAGLTSFATLEPDIAKFDMTLIRGVDTSATKQKLIRSMVNLCRELGTVTVAEGVETSAERDTLVSLGCELLQGDFIARAGRAFPEVRW